ncbi:MAG: hypothetical protein HY051_05035 [Candidatus Aenigmarchaeota archaeon]|nr:hypothetical protein [Candidatus Aenigmarchaeota archaeon]
MMKPLTKFQEVARSEDYQVMSSGHGSSYRFDGKDPDKPTLPNKTLLETYRIAIDWELHADTIGGRARIYKVSTGETISIDNASKIIEGAIIEKLGAIPEYLSGYEIYEEAYKPLLEELFGADAIEHR